MTGLTKVLCPGSHEAEHLVYADGHVRCVARGTARDRACEHLPGRRSTPRAGQQKPERQTDRERAQAGWSQDGRRPSWPDEEYQYALLKARVAAEARLDAEEAGADDVRVLSSLTKDPAVPVPTILEFPVGSDLLR